MKRIFALLLCFVLIVVCVPTKTYAVTEIKEVKLTLEYPEAGKTPPGTATWLTQGYSIYSIDWYDSTTGAFLETGDRVQAGHKYRATLWVKSMDGYEFSVQNSYTPNVKAYVNGQVCQAGKAFEYNAWAMVCVDYDFPAVPAKGWIKSVDLTITAPRHGQKPTYPQIDHTTYKYTNMVALPQYQNGINWKDVSTGSYVDPDATFRAGVQYTVQITIEQKAGYAFTPDAVASVNGRVVSSMLDCGCVLFIDATFTASEDNHTHFYTDWQYNSGQHYKNCTDCDEVFFVETHKGGQATCKEDGKCTVCGYAYEKAGEDKHVPDTTQWVAREDMYHFHACTLCGAHVDPEDHRWSPTYLYTDKDGHGWICADCKAHSKIEPHIPGAAATEQAPQTCTACGYVITPAIGQTATEPTQQTAAPSTPKETAAATTGATEAVQKKEPVENRQLDWKAVILVALVCFAAAITTTVIILKKKKGDNGNGSDGLA